MIDGVAVGVRVYKTTPVIIVLAIEVTVGVTGVTVVTIAVIGVT